MRMKAGRAIAALALLAGVGIVAGCGGGGGDGGSPQTTTLQHPLFPSTVGDTWTYEWFDRVTYLPTGVTTTETVTAVSGNALTITDDSGDETYYEIREDGLGRIYVVQLGGTGYTVSPAVVIIPPVLTQGANYAGGGYALTVPGLGAWTCSGHLLIADFRRIVVEAGTFDPAQEIYMDEIWQVPGGGTAEVIGYDWYFPGVGLVKRDFPEYDPSTGDVSPGWWVHLKSYSVH